MNIYQKSQGLTSYFSIGKYKGFKILRDGPTIRILLGCISISFSSISIEDLIYNLLQELKNKDAKEQELKQKEQVNEEIQKNQDEIQNKLKEGINFELNGQVSELNRIKIENVKKIEKLESENEELNDEVLDLGNELEKAEKKIKDKEDIVENLEKDIGFFKDDIEYLHQELENAIKIDMENAELLADNVELDAEVSRLEDQLDLLIPSSSTSSK